MTVPEPKRDATGSIIASPLDDYALPPLLRVRDLAVSFSLYEKGLRRKTVQPITALNLDVDRGELLAIIGASGSGKSLLAHALVGVLPSNATITGSMRLDGEELTPTRLAAYRGRRIALVPQGVTSLDPLMKVGEQVRRCAELSGHPRPAHAQQQAFERYELAPQVADAYPFELSGGMARRVLVSTAAVGDAELLVADEPTPGLQSELVLETLRHLRELADDRRGVIVITHDIEAAVQVADRVAVFYDGQTISIEESTSFSGDGSSLQHPYSQALWRALPSRGFTPVDWQPTPSKVAV